MAGSASGKFGRIDPFILFLVVPMLLVAGVMVWGGLAWVGGVVVVFALLVLLLDSWTNRPLPFEVPEDDYDYDEPPHRGGRRY